MADVYEFPKCCGIDVVGGFGNDGFAFNHSYTPEKVRDFIRVKSKTKGLTLLALNEKQIPLLEDVVLNEGFNVLVENFFHPGHFSRITLYGRVNFTEKEAKKKIEDQKEFEEKCRIQREQMHRDQQQYSSTARQTDSLTLRRVSTSSVSTTGYQPLSSTPRPNYETTYALYAISG